MNGTLVNTISIICGSLIGIGLKNGFIKEKSNAIMGALGLSVIIIGLQGVINYTEPLRLIVALALGVLIGEMIDLDNYINRLARQLEKRFSSGEEGRYFCDCVRFNIRLGSYVFCVCNLHISRRYNAFKCCCSTILNR